MKCRKCEGQFDWFNEMTSYRRNEIKGEYQHLTPAVLLDKKYDFCEACAAIVIKRRKVTK